MRSLLTNTHPGLAGSRAASLDFSGTADSATLTQQQVRSYQHPKATRFALQGGGEAQWFLGVAIVRDKLNRTIYLSQADYTRKMERYLGNGADLKAQKAPMAAMEGEAYTQVAIKPETQQY